MRKAELFFNGEPAGLLIEEEKNQYRFEYLENYGGPPISLTLPATQRIYHFDSFPTFFEGLLPEGAALEAMLRQAKVDRNDLFGQLATVGADLVGALTVGKIKFPSPKGVEGEAPPALPAEGATRAP